MFKKLRTFLLSALLTVSFVLPVQAQSVHNSVYPAVNPAVYAALAFKSGGSDPVTFDLTSTATLDASLSKYSGSYTRTGTMHAFDFEGILKKSEANVLPVYGGRAVTNLLTYSEDLSNAAWAKDAGVTITGTDGFTADSQNDKVTQAISTLEGHTYIISAVLSVPSGQLSNYAVYHSLSDTGTTTDLPSLTSTPTRYSVEVLGRVGGGNVYFGFSDKNTSNWAKVTITDFQVEDVTGQANQNPSEYVATTTASVTEWFNTENGNTVASNVVTEATGAALTNTMGAAFWPSVTNLFAADEYRDFSSWGGVTATVARDQVGVGGEPSGSGASTLSDDDGAAAENIVHNIAIDNDSNWQSFSILILKDTDETRYPYIVLNLRNGTALSEGVIFNTKTGAVTTEVVGDGEYDVLDLGTWYLLTLSIQNNTSGNTNARITQYPARSTDGINFVNSATGSIIVDWAQFVNARRCPVHLVEGAATLAAQSLIAADATNASKLIVDKQGYVLASAMLMPDDLSCVQTYVVRGLSASPFLLYVLAYNDDLASYTQPDGLLGLLNGFVGYRNVAVRWDAGGRQLHSNGTSSAIDPYTTLGFSDAISVGKDWNGIINSVTFGPNIKITQAEAEVLAPAP